MIYKVWALKNTFSVINFHFEMIDFFRWLPYLCVNDDSKKKKSLIKVFKDKQFFMKNHTIKTGII